MQTVNYFTRFLFKIVHRMFKISTNILFFRRFQPKFICQNYRRDFLIAESSAEKALGKVEFLFLVYFNRTCIDERRFCQRGCTQVPLFYFKNKNLCCAFRLINWFEFRGKISLFGISHINLNKDMYKVNLIFIYLLYLSTHQNLISGLLKFHTFKPH